MPKRRETILVFSAHNDDFVLGAGGTIKNYVDEGKNVEVLIFSYGEKSHPWLKEDVVQKMRVKESEEASKILGCKVTFFDLKEFKFLEEYKNKGVEKKLLSMIESKKPSKIFTHSAEDPHPDHQAVNKITEAILNKVKKSPEVYIFSVWNPVSFKTQYPSLYVNISKTFKLKVKAMKTFQSQKVHVAYPFFLLMYRSVRDGLKIRKRFAEQFFRIK